MRRFVSLCWEGDYADGFGACVKGPPAAPADFLEGSYHTVTWAKWSVAYWALGAADAALFVDADVVLLRNPFADAEVLGRKEALLYQGEDHCAAYSPTCALNSGQMLLRNRSMVEAVLAAMPARFGATTPLEQAIAAAALRADGYAATSLPPHFSGHCWFGRSGLSLCELTTYHAHCCVNDREKLAVIGRVLRDSAGCDFAHSAPGARSRCTLGECG